MGSLEQRVVFGLDPAEADRWWGGLQEEPWPPAEAGRRRSPPGRCRCRLTRWTLLWVPLSLCLVALSLYVAVAPYWIVRHVDVGDADGASESLRSSLGLFRRCRAGQPCRTFSTAHLLRWRQLPGLWLTAACVSALATLLAAVAAAAAAASCCTRVCGCVNIYKTAGTLNILTVLCHVVAAVVYPIDWGSAVVKDMCGDKAEAFVLDQCSIGWCVYALMLATLLNMACAALAMKIDAATPEYVEYGGVKS
ncbi:LHFPL tetraspan subfamily member 2a protein-like isoform X2 [Pollicipes pollicipes]|uniref:LHFPL tetraspan subfamily member 2a protein-like isoform X2 n=1 Tax=Pollicipes pollicipes TaxID=41117 RepID=UPI001884D763|nr:LHFPL tetraspan subfamily member 2a protein-like isoform X2 [Pollicipes pollicipes]